MQANALAREQRSPAQAAADVNEQQQLLLGCSAELREFGMPACQRHVQPDDFMQEGQVFCFAAAPIKASHSSCITLSNLFVCVQPRGSKSTAWASDIYRLRHFSTLPPAQKLTLDIGPHSSTGR